MVKLSSKAILAHKYFKELDWDKINPYDRRYYIALAGALIYKSNPMFASAYRVGVERSLHEILNVEVNDIRITDISYYLSVLTANCTIITENYYDIKQKLSDNITEVYNQTDLNKIQPLPSDFQIKNDTSARTILYQIYQLIKKMRYYYYPPAYIAYRETFITSPITQERFYHKRFYGGNFREFPHYYASTEDEYKQETKEHIEKYVNEFKQNIANNIIQKTWEEDYTQMSSFQMVLPVFQVSNSYDNYYRGEFSFHCSVTYGDCELVLPKGVELPAYLFVVDSRSDLFPPLIGPVKLPPKKEGCNYIIKFGYGENKKNSLYFKYDFSQIKMYKRILKFDKDFWKENPMEYEVENPEYAETINGPYFKYLFVDIHASGYFV
jgi:hypothetical protein